MRSTPRTLGKTINAEDWTHSNKTEMLVSNSAVLVLIAWAKLFRNYGKTFCDKNTVSLLQT